VDVLVAAPARRSPVRSVVESALRIRAFERALLDLFKGGHLSGTVHTCIGQELCAAALHPHLRPGVDAFFATHRGHGHYLAYGGSDDALLSELMGREGALCLGRGGTQNLRYRRFFSAGIQGGSTPVATGYAWALKRRGERAVVVAQIGDGTMGEGTHKRRRRSIVTQALGIWRAGSVGRLMRVCSGDTSICHPTAVCPSFEVAW